MIAKSYASLSQMGANGVKSVMYAGEGEPLLHKDISAIVNHAKASGIDNAFTTNGVHLTQRFLDEWENLSAGSK